MISNRVAAHRTARMPGSKRVFTSDKLGYVSLFVPAQWRCQILAGRGSKPQKIGQDHGVIYTCFSSFFSFDTNDDSNMMSSEVEDGISTVERIETMNASEPKAVVTMFRWPKCLGHPESVAVAGNFSNWTPVELYQTDNDGDWIRSISLSPGEAYFKFLLNGNEWKASPCERTVSDHKGRVNNSRLISLTNTISWPTEKLGGSSVMVAGDWSAWSELLPMEYDGMSRSHILHCCLPPGNYLIQFFVDGNWKLRVDTDSTHSSDGHFANILRVDARPAFKLFYKTGWPQANIRYRKRTGTGNILGEWQHIALHATEGRIDPESLSHSSWKTATILKQSSDENLEFVPVSCGPSNGEIGDEDRPPGGGVYECTSSGGFKLERGRLAPFVQANKPPIMLVSDLDGTLVGEGDHADQLTRQFGAYWENNAALVGSKLVYNTGRSLGQFIGLLEEKKGILPVPDAIITAVGTKIFLLDPETGTRATATGTSWKEDKVWAQMLDEYWDLESARKAATEAISLAAPETAHWLDDGSEHPHRVALSVRADQVTKVIEILENRMKSCGLKAKIIKSGQGDWRYIDCLSHGAGKLAALEYMRVLFGISKSRCIAAGDSGNDILMLGGANPAIVVGNAQPELLQWVTSQKQDGRLVLTDSVMADGVLEGLARLGLY